MNTETLTDLAKHLISLEDGEFYMGQCDACIAGRSAHRFGHGVDYMDGSFESFSEFHGLTYEKTMALCDPIEFHSGSKLFTNHDWLRPTYINNQHIFTRENAAMSVMMMVGGIKHPWLTIIRRFGHRVKISIWNNGTKGPS